jgi:membrane-bound serine protease (ClpP class)
MNDLCFAMSARSALRCAAAGLLLLLVACASPGIAQQSAAKSRVVVLDLAGPIGPASSDYVRRGLENAAQGGAALVVLRLDTPGGLDAAMRDIIQDILASPIAVVTWVAPSGARAASAGAYILLASHVAAMASATSVGAATPVRIGGASPKPEADEPRHDPDDGDDENDPPAARPGMDEKTLNDSVAYIRGLAQMRGRNAEWAEEAVRKASSIPASEAVRREVADLLADDLVTLLQQIDGRSVKTMAGTVTLSTDGAEVTRVDPDWRTRLLSVVTDPNVAYLLMLIGIYGLFFEMWNPGFLVPGVLGAICLVLALYAFQVLPVSFAGLGLLLLGIAFMIGEAFVPSFGVLGIGGVAAFVIGSIVLFDTDVADFRVAWELIAAVALLSAAFFIGVVTMALRSRRLAVVSGSEELVGALGEALETFRGAGRVRVHSEDWNASSNEAINTGDRVRVTGREGLTLLVERYDDRST